MSQETIQEASMVELMRHNAPEWYIIVFACISSFIHGGIHPMVGILFGGILGVSPGCCQRFCSREPQLFLSRVLINHNEYHFQD